MLAPWHTLLDVAIRTTVVYLALLAGIRLTGARQLGQMSTFDLVLLLIIANAVQNAMVGPDTSLAGGRRDHADPPRRRAGRALPPRGHHPGRAAAGAAGARRGVPGGREACRARARRRRERDPGRRRRPRSPAAPPHPRGQKERLKVVRFRLA